MRIAICEDEEVFAKELCQSVKAQMAALGFSSKTDIYLNPQKLLDQAAAYDLLLLDCMLGGGVTGMDVARSLRQRGCDTAIIFVTAYDDYVFEGYEVQAFRYLVKPIDTAVLNKTLSDFVKHYGFDDSLHFISKKRRINLKLSEILYIESSEKRTIVRSIDGSYETLSTITEFQNKINNSDFCRTHRRFIVNMRYIKDVKDNKIYLKNGEMVEISRRSYPEFQRQYINFMKYSKMD